MSESISLFLLLSSAGELSLNTCSCAVSIFQLPQVFGSEWVQILSETNRNYFGAIVNHLLLLGAKRQVLG